MRVVLLVQEYGESPLPGVRCSFQGPELYEESVESRVECLRQVPKDLVVYPVRAGRLLAREAGADTVVHQSVVIRRQLAPFLVRGDRRFNIERVQLFARNRLFLPGPRFRVCGVHRGCVGAGEVGFASARLAIPRNVTGFLAIPTQNLLSKNAVIQPGQSIKINL